MVEAILDAGAELLEKRGLAACTTNRIAERAGVSIGSLYTYFSDKNAVFSAIRQRLDRSIDDEVSSAVRAANGLGPEASARMFLHATISAITARAGLYRTLVLVHPTLGIDAERTDKLSPVIESLRSLVDRPGVLAPGRDATAVALVVWELVLAVIRAKLTHAGPAATLSDIEFDLMKLLHAYWLLIQADGSNATGAVV